MAADPVAWIIESSLSGVSPGYTDFISAMIPAACGAAIEVPS